jgi:hypothetical protein
MQEVGASTEQINDFVDKISKSISVNDALTLVDAKTEIQKFIKTNMKTAMVGKVEQVLGSFIFGREDSIPEMFQSLLDSWGLNEENAPCFVFYLKRHIQLDTDVHAPAAFDMLQNELNGDIDRLQVTLISAIEAVNARIGLWDAIEKELDSIG